MSNRLSFGQVNRARLYAFMLVACGGLLWSSFAATDLKGDDEARYVQVAKEMAAGGDWLVPHLLGEPYDQKPPLPFWLMAAVLRLSGEEVTSAVRLPSVVLGMLTVLLVFDIGRRRWDAETGLLAGLLLMTAPLFAMQVPTARLDAMLTAWVVVSMWAWLTAPPQFRLPPMRWVLFWGAATGAFFTKGPVALLFIFGAVLGTCGLQRKWTQWLQLRPAAGLIALASIAGLWVWAEWSAVGSGQIQAQVQTSFSERLRGDDHSESFWYYLKVIFGAGFMPWTFVLVWAVVHWWRCRSAGVDANGTSSTKSEVQALQPMLAWLIVPVIALSFVESKRRFYILPAVPAMALIAGWFLRTHALRLPLARSFRVSAAALGIIVVVGLTAAAVLIYERPDLFWTREFYVIRPHAVLLAGGSAAITGAMVMLAQRKTAAAFMGFAFVLVIIAELNLLAVVDAARNPVEGTRIFAQSVDRMVPAPERTIGAIDRAKKPEYHVYGHYTVQTLDFDAFDHPGALPSVVVVRANKLGAIEDKAAAAGYEVAYRLTAADEDLALLRRKPEQRLRVEPVSGVFRIALAGDAGTGDEHAKAIAHQIHREHEKAGVDGVVLLGDNVYGGKPFEINIEPAFLRPYRSLLRSGVPFYAVLGNHDDDAEGLREAEMNFPPFNMNGRNYRTVTYGGDIVTFFLLDSETLAGDPQQLRWFEQELMNCTSKWRIVALHRPLQASELAHGAATGLYRLLENNLRQGHIAAVVAGHNHVYERRVPVEGVEHITLGSGGKIVHVEFPPDEGRLKGYSERCAFGMLEVSRQELRFEVKNERGELVDEFVIEDPRSVAMAE